MPGLRWTRVRNTQRRAPTYQRGRAPRYGRVPLSLPACTLANATSPHPSAKNRAPCSFCARVREGALMSLKGGLMLRRYRATV